MGRLTGTERIFIIKDGKPVPIDKIPAGAIRVHLYPYQNVLRPRGSTEKESLGLDIYKRLLSTYEHWTDPKYGDNPKRAELVKQLKTNLNDEVQAAWNQFVKNIPKKGGDTNEECTG